MLHRIDRRILAAALTVATVLGSPAVAAAAFRTT